MTARDTVPQRWQSARLGDIATWGSGGTPKARDPRYYGGEIPFAVIGDLTDGPVSATAATITDFGLSQSSAKLVPPGALLIAMYGSIGKLGITTIPLATNQAIAFAIPRADRMDVRFLFYYLMAQRPGLTTAGKGATQQNIGQGILKQWPVPVPPLEEQRWIVDILEDHLSRIEAAVASLTMTRRRLVAYQRAALDGLTEDAATRHIALGQALAAVEAGRSFGDAARASFDDEWGIVKVSAMTWGEFRPSENKLVSDQSRVDLRYQIHAGDLLMSRANTSDYVGAPVLVRREPARLLLSDKSLRLVPHDGVSAEYLWRVLSAPRARAQISDRASGNQDSMRNISQAALKTIVIPWNDDQHGVIAAANELDEQRSRMSAVIDRSHTRGAALRRALLDAAFSGRLTGRSSDLEQVEEAVG